MHWTMRESEEGEMDVATLRMSNAEMQGRLAEAEQRRSEGVHALEDEVTAHNETQRKLRDAFAMLEKVRSDERDQLGAHTRAMEEQSAKELEDVQRQGVEQVYMYMKIWVYMYIYVPIYIYICVYVYMHMCIHVYIIYICIYTHVYIYIYTYIHKAVILRL